MHSTFLASTNPILFGCGVSGLIGEKLKEFGCKKVLVVYDKGVKAAGIADRILGHIHAAGIETVCYDGVLPDPPDYTVEAAGALGVRERVDGVVAVGGGSALDTGKAAKVLLTNPPPISNYYLAYEDVQPDDKTMKPIIVIPTTSGTGSEATPGGVITDTKRGVKQNVPCATNLGIVDPELALGLPLPVTASTAVDALCHAVEAFTSGEPNAISDVLAREAISLIGKNLPAVFKNSADLKAREGLQLAATLAGLSIMGPFCNVPHEIGLVLGTVFHLPHGTACGATLPEALEFLAPAIPEKVAAVARLLGAEVSESAAPEEIGKTARGTVRALYGLIGMPGLKTLVASKEALLAAVPDILAYSPFHFSARPVSTGDLREILGKAYDA
ncbi:1,3-propanediol dehydrogenase [Sporobacter termitidis DSM 10068]|uniref:1,3-propanediol dehydrogenase n=1 Tax=Sporobacter termitidis DSM 10068 TaxID=1123282 RepID=A0A1M5YL34_9FIRM|nr:iron-containing alcohol dehydrogenase [Sporobacter termitidis]SHI12756.1 1,3-propanediol dehydrogenase [Sporobacter termitidis DSM 10068]